MVDYNINDRFNSYFELTEGRGRPDYDYESVIKMTYFAVTTLTTVGFGDFHPRSDFERVIITIEMLFGVAIFAFFLGEFIG